MIPAAARPSPATSVALVNVVDEDWAPSRFQEDPETLMAQAADAIRLARMICAASAELVAKSTASGRPSISGARLSGEPLQGALGGRLALRSDCSSSRE